MTTEQRIEQIKERTDKAAAGPWRQFDTYIAGVANVFAKHNQDFIAHAREDVPFLLARIAELERWKRNAIEIISTATNRPANQTEGESDK
jgi:hypothetical protein